MKNFRISNTNFFNTKHPEKFEGSNSLYKEIQEDFEIKYLGENKPEITLEAVENSCKKIKYAVEKNKEFLGAISELEISPEYPKRQLREIENKFKLTSVLRSDNETDILYYLNPGILLRLKVVKYENIGYLVLLDNEICVMLKGGKDNSQTTKLILEDAKSLVTRLCEPDVAKCWVTDKEVYSQQISYQNGQETSSSVMEDTLTLDKWSRPTCSALNTVESIRLVIKHLVIKELQLRTEFPLKEILTKLPNVETLQVVSMPGLSHLNLDDITSCDMSKLKNITLQHTVIQTFQGDTCSFLSGMESMASFSIEESLLPETIVKQISDLHTVFSVGNGITKSVQNAVYNSKETPIRIKLNVSEVFSPRSVFNSIFNSSLTTVPKGISLKFTTKPNPPATRRPWGFSVERACTFKVTLKVSNLQTSEIIEVPVLIEAHDPQ